jgi:hypothetical protein
MHPPLSVSSAHTKHGRSNRKKRRKTAKGGLNQSWSSVDTTHNDRIFFEKRREKMMIVFAVKLHRPPT